MSFRFQSSTGQRNPPNYKVKYNKPVSRLETPPQMGGVRILIDTELMIYNNTTDTKTIQQEIIGQIVKNFDLIKCVNNSSYEVRDNTDLNFIYNDEQSAILCHNNMLVLFKNNLEPNGNSKFRETFLYEKLLTNVLTKYITFEPEGGNFRKVIIKGSFILSDFVNKQTTSYDLKQQICNHLFRHFNIVNMTNGDILLEQT